MRKDRGKDTEGTINYFIAVDPYVFEKYPPCPECGGNNINSNGYPRLICKDCGKSYRWFYRGHKTIERKDNPCPECHSTHISSKGINWFCNNCGKNFRKIRRRDKDGKR